MTISKEELFARYKQLKSEGVSITLMELKKQMEAEAQTSAPTEVNETNSQPTGFSALSQTVAPQNDYNHYNSSAPVEQQPTYQEQQPYQQSYQEQPYQQPQQEQTFQPSYQEPHQEQPQPLQPSDYSNAQVSSWSTTYISGQEQTPTPAPSLAPTPVQPSFTVNETLQNNYSNNFTSSFSFQSVQPQTQAQSQTQALTATVQSSMFQPIVTNTPIQQPPVNSERTKFCLIGYPLGHSLSTFIHEAGFKSLNLNYTYEILETPPEKLVDRIKYLKYNNFAGFNVTIPLKLPVTMFLDEIDLSADLIGAVNTVIINPDRSMKGYNTDVLGFRNAIPQDITLAEKTIGILGTGGAARAAITAFALEQVKQIKIYTRNIPNSIELLNYLRSKFPTIEFNAYQIQSIRDLSDIDILVNTTPIGMQGRAADLTPVEEKELKTLPQGALVYDVIYNPKKTVLLKLAQKNGYRTINGVDMFIHQAVAAEKIWTGRTPDFKDMKIAALENL